MRARPQTIHGIDLTQPDGITRLLEYRRSLHGEATMTAGTGEQQQTGETGTGEQGGTGEQQSGAETADEQRHGGRSPDPTPRFTQGDLDDYLSKVRKEEKQKYAKALEEAQALAGKSELEKLQTQLEQERSRTSETTQKAAERVAKTEAKVAALAAGANPERINAIIRNADLAAAVKDGEVDEAAVKAAIDAVLTEYPEWKKAHTGPSSSGGELNGSESGKPSFTRAQIEAMSPDERVRRIEEINDAMANGRITG